MGRAITSRVLTATLAVAALLVTGQSARAADASGSWGVTSTDATGLMYENDLLLSHSSNGSFVPCQGGLSACSPDDGFTLMNTLVPCESGGVIACVREVSASSDGQSWIEGKHLGERVKSWPIYSYSARPDLGFGASHGPNLYQFPGLKSDKSDLFEVAPRMQANAQSGKPLVIDTITTRVQAVRKDPSVVRSGFVPPRPGLSGDEWLKSIASCLDGQHITSECWINDSQTSKLFFKVELALPSAPDGWVSGRVFRPNVVFATDSKNPKLPVTVSVSGSSMTVPFLAKSYFAFNPGERAIWDLLGNALNSPWRNDSISRGLALSPLDLDMFLTGLSHDPSWDKAASERTEWISNLSWQEQLVRGSTCRQSGFEGFIGSNALVYESNLPVFDAISKEMTYRVASPHSLSNGEIHSGAYSLVISEKLARCIWRLDSKIGRLSLSVTNEDGTSKAATTSLNLQDGLLSFEAAGFTFSEVKLQARFVPEDIVVNTPVAKRPIGKPVVIQKKTTITCVKGKLIKKMTAVGPKCPAGYKKK